MNTKNYYNYNDGEVLWNMLGFTNYRESSVNLINRFGQEKHRRGQAFGSLAYMRKAFKGMNIQEVFTSIGMYNKDEYRKAMQGSMRAQRQEYFETAIPEKIQLVFDFDSKDVKRAAQDCFDVMMLLEDYVLMFGHTMQGIKRQIVFSGRKGFHLEYDKYFHQNALPFVAKEAEKLSRGFKSLDHKIYTLRREWRCPYSLNSSTGLVALPLTMNHFNYFLEGSDKAIENVLPERVIKNGIRNRGCVWL